MVNTAALLANVRKRAGRQTIMQMVHHTSSKYGIITRKQKGSFVVVNKQVDRVLGSAASGSAPPILEPV